MLTILPLMGSLPPPTNVEGEDRASLLFNTPCLVLRYEFMRVWHALCTRCANFTYVGLHGHYLCSISDPMAQRCGEVCCGGVPATPSYFFPPISACCCDTNGHTTHTMSLSWDTHGFYHRIAMTVVGTQSTRRAHQRSWMMVGKVSVPHHDLWEPICTARGGCISHTCTGT